MKLKSITLSLLSLLLAVTFTSCSGNSESPTTPDGPEVSDPTPEEKPTPKPENKYKVEFIVDGEVVETDTVKENDTASYDGKTPTKASTSEFSYTFESWEPALGKVTKDMQYVAKFKEEKRQYEISFYDEIGNLLSKEKFQYGTIPSYNYTKEDTPSTDYKVLGFSSTIGGEVLVSLPKVTGDAKYYAIVSETPKSYTITFDLNGGTGDDKLTKKYGEVVNELYTPTKKGYRFVCWCTDPELKEKVTLPLKMTSDITLYAKYNENVPILNYLKSLLTSYNQNPYNLIPDTMRYDYKANLTTEDKVNHDYTNFVNVEKIVDGGFGEQWSMVSDNLRQSKRFYDILNIVESLGKTSVVLFERYLDENPSDTADFTHKDGIYTITIKYSNNIISYSIDYKGNVPLFGEQNINISLSNNIKTNEKVCKIKIGEANQLKYTIKDNLYSFGITYLGIRTAYFDIKTLDKNNYVGHIYEFIHKDKLVISSAAEFYIDNNYVRAIGNKASGMLGWTGVINELYDIKTGKLLGYEVKENLSKIEYHTLWLNMSDFIGINNIKLEKNPDTKPMNPYLVYANNSSDPFSTKKVGGISAQTLSRRFDIELREETRYMYDSQEKEFKEIKYQVPKVFVQENFYTSLTKDVLEVNNNLTTFWYNNTNNKVETIINDHKTLVPVFEANKDNITVDQVKDYILK